MDDKQRMIITIDEETGTVVIETSGFKGDECITARQKFLDRMRVNGSDISEGDIDFKDSYYKKVKVPQKKKIEVTSD